MAYQNISIPRFFVDHLLWLKTLGHPYYIEASQGGLADASAIRSGLIGLNPSSQILMNYTGEPPTLGDQYITYKSAPNIPTEVKLDVKTAVPNVVAFKTDVSAI